MIIRSKFTWEAFTFKVSTMFPLVSLSSYFINHLTKGLLANLKLLSVNHLAILAWLGITRLIASFFKNWIMNVIHYFIFWMQIYFGRNGQLWCLFRWSAGAITLLVNNPRIDKICILQCLFNLLIIRPPLYIQLVFVFSIWTACKNILSRLT